MELPLIAQVAASAGIALTVVQYWMKTMIPLRVVGLVTNVLFLVYSAIGGIWPTLVLNCIVLPLNLYRVHEMRELIRRTKRAARSDLDMSWLQPFMTRRRTKAGQVLFRKGDIAEAMYLVISGRFVLQEIDVRLEPGAVVGELGLLSPEGLRTQTLVSLDDGEVLSLAYEKFEELYFQNPEFGLGFLKLTSRRLFENIARLESELASRPPRTA
ncbi:MAG: cyclic nucleotide-binding domain-containing protein [Candidatus Hydrogenedentes bacterium]|nr:cyclic nucleotide-binding domain-containing protein [Candidatus Hydrogenedentota bacterium]